MMARIKVSLKTNLHFKKIFNFLEHEMGSTISSISPMKPMNKSVLELVTDRYRRTKKVVTSKPARMVLAWSFLVMVVNGFIASLSTYHTPSNNQMYLVIGSVYNSLIHLLYPVAGLLADVKIGRYKTIMGSVWILIAVSPFILLGSGMLVTASQLDSNSLVFVVLVIVGGFVTGTGLMLMICSTTAFNANAVQFGLDQLHDSSTDEQVVFIEWFLWLFYAATVIFQATTTTLYFHGYFSAPVIFYTKGSILSVIAMALIFITYFSHNIKHWFVFNTKLTNPYRLVYQVTLFSRRHKIPVHRSALTYCEDSIPSGLDLGKTKYGGPYTTEQVEDVKAFYGILRILCSIGPIYFLEFAAYTITGIFKLHILKNYYYFYDYFTSKQSVENNVKFLLIGGFIIYDIIVIIWLPLYILFIRPLVSHYIPRTHIRMGIEILSIIVSLIVSLGIEIVGHYQDPSLKCMFSSDPTKIYLEGNATYTPSPVVTSFYYVILFQQIISRIFTVIGLIAKYEFMLSQSPNAMKGLIIGISYAIEGVFRVLGAVFILPFILYWKTTSLPSCGTLYFALNICIALVTMMIFICTSKKYQDRIRDEPCYVHRYVEEYYSKIVASY